MRVRPAFSPRDRALRRARRWRAAGVVTLALALYAALLWPLRGFVTDDTYIHLVYAKHFRDGLGLVFNPGEPVYGTTSPLWSLALGVLGRSGIDLLVLSKALSVLFGALAIGMVALFLRRFMGAWVDEFGYGRRRAEFAWALATLLFATDAWHVRWAASGMETALGTFLIAGGLAAYVARRPWGTRVLWPALWWSIAALARPEAAVLLVLLTLRILLSTSERGLKLWRLALVAMPVLAVHVPWLVFAMAHYGTLTPATLAAKSAGGGGIGVFFEFLGRQARALAAVRGVELVTLVALAPSLVGRLWVRRADHFVPFLWLTGLPLLYAARGVPPISRYLVPLVPVLLAYAWGALAWNAARERRRPALAACGLALVAVLALGNSLWTYARYVVPQANAFSEDVKGALAGLAAWCRENTPPGTPIAIPDIGAFAYYADRPVVDLAGLVTPAITPLLRRTPYDELVTNLGFEGVARPPYLIDRADRPRRMLFQSPYAPCLTVIAVARVDHRGIQRPEPAFYTLYRIDWVAFDRMAGGERQASLD